MQPTREELVARYSKLSNDHLLDIVTNHSDYTPEALELVRAEIEKRKIGSKEFEQYTQTQQAREEEILKESVVPLALWEKLIFFFAWFIPGFIAQAFQTNYGEDNHYVKLSQSTFYRIAGFVSLLAGVFIGIGLSLGDISTLLILLLFFGITYFLDRKIYE